MEKEEERRLKAESGAANRRGEQAPGPAEQLPGGELVTMGQVQAALNGLMGRIAALCATKGDLARVEAALAGVAASSNRNFVSRDEARKIAERAVPEMLRDISNGDKRAGNVLLLSPGGEGKRDSVYFGQIKPGTKLPAGEAATPHLVWDAESGKWSVGRIVPAGSDENPHLIWDTATAGWIVGRINDVPDGTIDEPHLVWNALEHEWQPGVIVPAGDEENPHLIWDSVNNVWVKGNVLPSGGLKYQVLQKASDEDGDWTVDYVRWHI